MGKTRKDVWKETPEIRAERVAIEQQHKFRSKTWSKNGNLNDHRSNRRQTKIDLRNYND